MNKRATSTILNRNHSLSRICKKAKENTYRIHNAEGYSDSPTNFLLPSAKKFILEINLKYTVKQLCKKSNFQLENLDNGKRNFQTHEKATKLYLNKKMKEIT